MLYRRVSYRFSNQPAMNQSRAKSFQRFKAERKEVYCARFSICIIASFRKKIYEGRNRKAFTYTRVRSCSNFNEYKIILRNRSIIKSRRLQTSRRMCAGNQFQTSTSAWIINSSPFANTISVKKFP